MAVPLLWTATIMPSRLAFVDFGMGNPDGFLDDEPKDFWYYAGWG